VNADAAQSPPRFVAQGCAVPPASFSPLRPRAQSRTRFLKTRMLPPRRRRFVRGASRAGFSAARRERERPEAQSLKFCHGFSPDWGYDYIMRRAPHQSARRSGRERALFQAEPD